MCPQATRERQKTFEREKKEYLEIVSQKIDI